VTDPNSPESKSGINAHGLDYAKIEAIVSQLANAIAQSREAPPDAGARQIALRADYLSTVDVIKLLSDIRFRCLVFVTAVIAVADALLPGTGDPGTRIALGFVGFLTTLGIAVYELRNSQLYEAAIHRAKILEGRLIAERTSKQSDKAGLFSERPPYVEGKYWKRELDQAGRNKALEDNNAQLMSFWLVAVKHDRGLALIYGAVLGGWVYLIADGLLSLPPPAGIWRPAPAGLTRIISALIAFSAFALSYKQFVDHDKQRFRPDAPSNNGNDSGAKAAPASASASIVEGSAEVSGNPERRA
jgi:hypothetical protein